MKLEGINGKRLTELSFSEKLSFYGKNPQKYGFLAFVKNLVCCCVFVNIKMVRNSVLYEFVKTICLEKIWFFSFGLKSSQPIKLLNSLIMNTSERNQSIS